MSSIGRYTGKATGGNPGFSSSVANGLIPASLLGHLETQPVTAQFPANEHYLARDAAVGFDAMVRAAERDGVKIRLLEAYRTLERQRYFWRLYLAGGNLAASPGTSNHGWGTAIDVDRRYAEALPWMRLHADEYGWDLPDELGKREPWHWQWIRGFRVASLPLLRPQATPVYVRGELVPGAFYSFTNGVNTLFLRPVVEELGYEVEVSGQVVTLDQGGEINEQSPTYSLPLVKSPDGRAIIPARALCDKLGIPCEWDSAHQAVRIG